MKGKAQTECVFCHPTHPEDIVLWDNSLFCIKPNIYPYEFGNVLLTPKRHIHSILDMTPREYKVYQTLIPQIVQTFKNKFGGCLSLVRDDTPAQSQWHFHHHFMPTDNSLVNGISRVEYRKPNIDFSKLVVDYTNKKH